MITNADITIYNSIVNPETRLREWKATVIKGVHFYVDNKVALTEKGLASADICKIRVPVSADFGGTVYVPSNEYTGTDHTWTLKTDDYVIGGVLMMEIEKPADLQGKASQIYKITSWADNRSGGLKHWRIGGI